MLLPNPRQLLFGHTPPLLALSNLGQGLGILLGKFPQSFFIKLNPALVPVGFAFQLQAALLHPANLPFQLGPPLAELNDFIFATQHLCRVGFDLVAQVLGRPLPLVNFRLQHIKLMPRKLGIQVL